MERLLRSTNTQMIFKKPSYKEPQVVPSWPPNTTTLRPRRLVVHHPKSQDKASFAGPRHCGIILTKQLSKC